MREPLAPEWVELRQALSVLASEAGAHNAYVLDAWCTLWCSAHKEDADTQSAVIELARDELGSLEAPLQRSGGIDRRAHHHRGHAYLKSFGAVYVVVLRHSAAFDVAHDRALVTEALQTIEPFVIGLV